MLPIHDVADAERYLDKLRLDPRSLIVATEQEDAVRATMADVAERGDAALVEAARKFDDPEFTADQLRVTPDEMEAAHGRVLEELRVALSRAIDQVRAYQQHIMPTPPSPMDRGG
ncbi:MAG: histidinol dehydrogenase, partial [Planctomycetota bacterium]